jgi:hypothetical protein
MSCKNEKQNRKQGRRNEAEVGNVRKMIVGGRKGSQNNIKVIKHCGNVKSLWCSWLPQVRETFFSYLLL